MATITQRIFRNRRGTRVPVGMLVAAKFGEQTYIGWSKCNTGKDSFDKAMGFKIAMDRITLVAEGHPLNFKMPHSIQKDVDVFAERTTRYFKNQPKLVGTVVKDKSTQEAQESTQVQAQA